MRFWRKHQDPGPRVIEAENIAISVTHSESEVLVAVSGRVTVDSSPHLRSCVLRLLGKGGISEMRIDLSGVSYIDTSGVATLLEALRKARQMSIRLTLSGVGGQARMLVEAIEIPAIFQRAGSEVLLC
jgi:anti-sigma B factor antagonist